MRESSLNALAMSAMEIFKFVAIDEIMGSGCQGHGLRCMNGPGQYVYGRCEDDIPQCIVQGKTGLSLALSTVARLWMWD